MNLLTKTVLEDLIKMDLSLSKMTFETHTEIEKELDYIAPKPAEIILKIMGLNHENYYNFVTNMLDDVYEEKLTISEAIDKLEQERELVR